MKTKVPLTPVERGKLGGRPPGSKSPENLLKEAVKKAFDQKVLRASDRLFIAQVSLAVGQQFLYKIEKEFIKTGTTKSGEEKGYWKSLPPKLVVTQQEIEDFLVNLVNKANGEVEDENNPEDTYYYLTTKEPVNQAITDLLNRTMGKPKESLDITGDVKFSLKGLAQRRHALQSEAEQKLIDVEASAKELPPGEKRAEDIS